MFGIPRKNVITLFLAIGIGAVAAATFDSDRLLRHAAIALPATFIMKAASKRECHSSDVGLTLAVFVLVVGSKFLFPNTSITLILEGSAILLVLIFMNTGLSFKEIASIQKRTL